MECRQGAEYVQLRIWRVGRVRAVVEVDRVQVVDQVLFGGRTGIELEGRDSREMVLRVAKFPQAMSDRRVRVRIDDPHRNVGGKFCETFAEGGVYDDDDAVGWGWIH